jgi:AraC-like DNA-binding protein
MPVEPDDVAVTHLDVGPVALGGVATSRPRFVLIRMRTGQGLLRHRGGETALGPDECVLVDGREPYDLQVGAGSRSVCLHVPVDWVEGYLPDPKLAIGVPLGSLEPWVTMLREVIDAIHADNGASSPPLIARSLCTALALCADAIEVHSTAHSRATFQSLQRTLAELAPTSHVTSAEIAQAHGISRRYLHAIYAANGTSCNRELIRVRLERAHRLLREPSVRDQSIEDIAWQCGFADAGHFRRRFRAQFGVSPSAVRKSAGGR